jgi:hypothetical protein
MNLEQIIFLTIAIALSVFSMYRKSKKRKQSLPKEEESYHDFPQQQDTSYPPEPVLIFEPFDVPKSPQNFNIHTKKSKKKQKQQNVETVNFQSENSNINLQNADLESDISLLEDFEGKEIQKAFLYREIFKSTKN